MQREHACPDDQRPHEEWADPIVAEVRSVREQILAGFDYDIRDYAAHVIAIQEEKNKRGLARYVEGPIRKPGRS